MKCDTSNNEEEGELFDFESGDEVPEADRQAPAAHDGTGAAEAGGADESTSPDGTGVAEAGGADENTSPDGTGAAEADGADENRSPDGTGAAETGSADENTSPAGQCHSHAALGPVQEAS